jgi:cation transporter-like permease
VFLSLFHLFVGILIWHAKGQKVTFDHLIGNGSLLFFAAALTAKSFGDYYKNVSVPEHLAASLIAICGILFILMPTVAIYGSIVNAVSGGSQHDLPLPFVTRYSSVMAVLSVLYGLVVFLLVAEFQKK